jgi:hypothetical protein
MSSSTNSPQGSKSHKKARFEDLGLEFGKLQLSESPPAQRLNEGLQNLSAQFANLGLGGDEKGPVQLEGVRTILEEKTEKLGISIIVTHHR